MANKTRAERMLQLRGAGMSRTVASKFRGFGRHGACDTFDAASGRGVTYASAADMSRDGARAPLFPEKCSREPAYAPPDREAGRGEPAKAGATPGPRRPQDRARMRGRLGLIGLY